MRKTRKATKPTLLTATQMIELWDNYRRADKEFRRATLAWRVAEKKASPHFPPYPKDAHRKEAVRDERGHAVLTPDTGRVVTVMTDERIPLQELRESLRKMRRLGSIAIGPANFYKRCVREVLAWRRHCDKIRKQRGVTALDGISGRAAVAASRAGRRIRTARTVDPLGIAVKLRLVIEYEPDGLAAEMAKRTLRDIERVHRKVGADERRRA